MIRTIENTILKANAYLHAFDEEKKLFDLYAHRTKNSQLNSAYRRINMFNMFIHSNEFAIIVVNIIIDTLNRIYLPLSLSLIQ